MELKNRRALVTGAAIRVGREIALELARAGADLVVHYRSSAEAAKSTADEIRATGVACDLVAGDLADPADLERVAAECAGVDVLVNSASIFPRTPLADVTIEQWDDIYAANLRAPFFLARTIGLAMKKRGRGAIVNITDWSAERPYRGYLPYCASKAGLVALTKGLAKTLAPEVRVNAVAPGPVMLPEDMTDAERDIVLRQTPLAREGRPENVAKAVRFLVETADFTTGASLTVDGGRLIN